MEERGCMTRKSKQEQVGGSNNRRRSGEGTEAANSKVMVGVDALAWTVEDKEPPASSAINVFVTGQPGTSQFSFLWSPFFHNRRYLYHQNKPHYD